MRTEIRFLLAVVLMIGVLVVTNLMFPPVPPEEMPGYVPPDSALVSDEGSQTGGAPSAGPGALLPAELAPGGAQEEDPLAAVMGGEVAQELAERRRSRSHRYGGGPSLLLHLLHPRRPAPVRPSSPTSPPLSPRGRLSCSIPARGPPWVCGSCADADTVDLTGLTFRGGTGRWA